MAINAPTTHGVVLVALVVSLAGVAMGRFSFNFNPAAILNQARALRYAAYVKGVQDVVVNVPHLGAIFVIDKKGKPQLVSGCTSQERGMLKLRYVRPSFAEDPVFALYSIDDKGKHHFLEMTPEHTLTTVRYGNFRKYEKAIRRSSGKERSRLNGTFFRVTVKKCLSPGPLGCPHHLRSHQYGRDLVFTMEAVKKIRNQQKKALSNKAKGEKKQVKDICKNNLGPFHLTSSNPAQSPHGLKESSEVHVHIDRKPYFWAIHGANTYQKDCPPHRHFTDDVCNNVCAQPTCTPKLRTTYDLMTSKPSS